MEKYRPITASTSESKPMPRCFDCGLLAVRDEYDVSRIVEATDDARVKGRQQCSNGTSPPCKFFCYANSMDFPPAAANGTTPEKLDALQSTHACNSWRRREHGKSPREMEEMILQQDVLAMRREMLELNKAVHDWQQLQADSSQRFERQLQALQEVRHQEALTASRSQASGTNWQAVGTIVAAVAAIASVVISLFALFR